MSFAEEQLARLNASLVTSQRECGRLKARLEKVEEEHSALKILTEKATKDYNHEKLRRENMVGRMKAIAKERRALHRQATDTERYTLEQGRRWEERAIDLREELAEAKERADQLDQTTQDKVCPLWWSPRFRPPASLSCGRSECPQLLVVLLHRSPQKGGLC